MPLRFDILDSSSSEEENDINFPQLQMQVQQIERKNKVYRSRINFDFVLEAEFVERFRMSGSSVEKILNVIGPLLEHKTKKNKALDPRKQLLVALHFLGSGNQYHGISDMHGIHKSTVCRSVNRVCRAIIRKLFHVYVRWPSNCDYIQPGFFGTAGFPRVAGAIDGTLIPIQSPRFNESDFVDRHGNHSINTMVVCGPNNEFFYASARWPGSVHDNRVLRNSTLFQKWEIDGKYTLAFF